MAAQAPVEAVRRQLLSDADRNRLIDLGIWAHVLLGDAEIAERLVDRFFDLTTVERVRAFAANRELVIDAFEAAVRRQCTEQRARRQSRNRLDAPATAELALAYTSLGLSGDASPATVCQAYRMLAKRYHPDLGGDEGRMKEVNQAYSRIAATWR